MKSNFRKIIDIVKFEFKYLYLRFLPIHKYESFLKKEYKKRVGEELNIKKPEKYTEKIQYAKLYLNSPIKSRLSDKYKVREWVEEKIGSEYLIPLLGVWDRFSDINFESLPNQFVLKMNNGSATNIIVKDKKKLDYFKAKIKFMIWMNRNFAFAGDIQPHYAEIQPKIIAEKYMEDPSGGLVDYKFLCFNGKVYYCWIDVGRFDNHYRNVYDLNWKLQPWNQFIYSNTPYDIEKPDNFEEMKEIAHKLCQGFSHVRVDLYNINGKIYFGEMTFTNGSGYEFIKPDKYNYILGNLWDFDKDKRDD